MSELLCWPSLSATQRLLVKENRQYQIHSYTKNVLNLWLVNIFRISTTAYQMTKIFVFIYLMKTAWLKGISKTYFLSILNNITTCRFKIYKNGQKHIRE